MRKKLIWCTGAMLSFVLMLFVQCGIARALPEREIEAEGVAAVKSDAPDDVLRARDEAINRALRRAVEQGVGTLIDSESLVENFQLLDDRIYSQVKGYVKSYEIIEDNEGEGGVYRINVRALVALASLEKDLKALNLIRAKKDNPRIMVIISETIDGLPQGGNVTQTEMEKTFLAKSFPLIDKGQFDAVRQRDATINYTDPVKAAALGQRYGAEVVVVGEATSDLVDSSNPYGVSVFFYKAQSSAKAIKVDTASIVATESVETDWRKQGEGQGSGRTEAAKQALKAAGKRLADAMMTQIVENWRSEVFNVISIQIVAENVNSKRRKALKNALASVRGVESVDERNFTKGMLTLDVTVEGAVWADFDERLEELDDIGVELTGKTQNRIDVKLFDKPGM